MLFTGDDSITMKRATGTCKAAAKAKAAPGRISIQSIYADAMREVMADPRKAIAEHDPWLAALLAPQPPVAKS